MVTIKRELREVLKSKLKTILNTYPKINYKKLEEKLIQSDVVSFDVFDTLLKRDVAEVADVFSFIEQKWNQGNLDNQLHGFKKARIKAEAKAYEKYNSATTLANIYEYLDVPEGVQELEVACELGFNVANEPMLAIFNRLRQLNKRIFIISDMYLPSTVIAQMLEQAGYAGFEKLYVSCEYAKDKKHGDLFTYVSNDVKIQPERFTHVGDSWRTDWSEARKKEFKPAHIARYDHRLPYQINSKDLNASTLQALMNNRIVNHDFNAYQTFGYTAFGPILLGFSQWLYENINATDKLFFLARDGHIVQQAFNMLFPTEETSSYLYVSRKSLKQPLLQYVQNLEEMAELLRLPSTYTIAELADALGLDMQLIANQDTDKVYTDPQFANDAVLKQFVTEHLDLIKANSEREGDALAQYLKQENFSGTVSVVDIGWRGSMQAYLLDFMAKHQLPIKINGWYVGLNGDANKYSIEAQSYWFDMKNEDAHTDLATPFQGMLELLFSATHGTTIGYQKNGAEVQPQLAPFEFTGSEELEKQAVILNDIRQAALDFIVDFKNSALNGVVTVSPEEAFETLQRIGLHPTLAETKMFGDLLFVDQNANELAKPKSGIKYVFNPKQLKYDLFASRWKIGFMKRLLKLPVNYYWLYKKLK